MTPPAAKVGTRGGAGWARLLEASLMTALAGFVDAVGYTATGHLYLSFMSGNSTQLGLAIVQGDRRVIIGAGAVVAAFVLGAFLGALIAAFEVRSRLPLVLAGECLLFVTAWWLLGRWPADLVLLLPALAMGMQNAIRKSVAGAAIGRSYITGTLFGVGDALARRVLGTAGWAEIGAYAASWLSFIAGVVCGAVLIVGEGLPASLVAAAAAVFTLMVPAIVRLRSTPVILPGQPDRRPS